jgi:phage terminase small subunit
MQRGRKPKPTHLKLVEGNPGHRALPEDEPTVSGDPVRPKWLKGRPSALWDEVLAFAYWLTVADSYKLAAWCDRQADFEKSRKDWTAADRREHRSLGSELGLDPSSRARMGNDLRGVGSGSKATKPKDVAAKYFDKN